MSKPPDLADRSAGAAAESIILRPLPTEPPSAPSPELVHPLSDFVKFQVGKRSLPAVYDEIRRCMLMEAVRISRGNITKSACILGLTRQAVQQMLSSFELKDWASRLREIARSIEPPH